MRRQVSSFTSSPAARRDYRFAFLRTAAAIPSAITPSAASDPLAGPGLAAQETFATPEPVHVSPEQVTVPLPLASTFAVRTPLRADTQSCTLLALTYAPLQKIAPLS